MSRSKSWMIGTGVESPCRECEVREPACHDHCEKYAKYRKELEIVTENKREYQTQKYIRTDRNAQIKSSFKARKNARRKRNEL